MTNTERLKRMLHLISLCDNEVDLLEWADDWAEELMDHFKTLNDSLSGFGQIPDQWRDAILPRPERIPSWRDVKD